MNWKSPLVLFLIVISISSCKKEEGTLHMDFRAFVGDQEFSVLTPYDVGDDRMNFTVLDYFIYDAYLTSADGDKVPLIELDLVDFDASYSENFVDGAVRFSVEDIPGGSYSRLTYSVGVPPDLNSQTPNVFPPDNILSYSGRYWDAWNSYIFMRFQGNILNENGSNELGWLFHTGMDTMFTTVSLPISFTVDGGETTLNVGLDVLKLLKTEDDTYFDLRNSPTNHNPQKLEPMKMIMDNLEKSTTLTIE